MIDLRSDTVTQPDDEMRRAMATAVVGDDLFGEDPTVQELEQESAEVTGHEASLFVPSGTMANQIALHLLAKPGTEVICEAASHILFYEMAAMAVVSGLFPRPVAGARGLLDPAMVESAVAPDLEYRSATGLLALENTAMEAAGNVYGPQEQDALIAFARSCGLPVHLDGARVFNAAEALQIEVARLTSGFDTVMFTLSKGLGAPVGSMLCGSRERMRKARRIRKMFGGTMRQVGVVAAAGLVALRKGPSHLATDHQNAGRLAEALAGLEPFEVDPKGVRTNIVIARCPKVRREDLEGGGNPAGRFVAELEQEGVRCVALDSERVRFVTHRDVSPTEIETAIATIERVASRD